MHLELAVEVGLVRTGVLVPAVKQEPLWAVQVEVWELLMGHQQRVQAARKGHVEAVQLLALVHLMSRPHMRVPVAWASVLVLLVRVEAVVLVSMGVEAPVVMVVTALVGLEVAVELRTVLSLRILWLVVASLLVPGYRQCPSCHQRLSRPLRQSLLGRMDQAIRRLPIPERPPQPLQGRRQCHPPCRR